MALKGLDIFKLSPKKNCKECGSPTCMAFCMKVAQGAVSIDKCPYFSDDAKAMLNEQTAPPMKTITVGDHKLGGETVLFRHEKTLVNKNLYAVSVCTCISAEEADKKLAELQKVDYERIGERMYVEFVFVANKQSDPAVYAELVKKAAATGRDLILECWDVECAKAALAVAGKNVILDGATPENYEAMNAVAKEAGVVLGVHADTISDLYDTVKKPTPFWCAALPSRMATAASAIPPSSTSPVSPAAMTICRPPTLPCSPRSTAPSSSWST